MPVTVPAIDEMLSLVAQIEQRLSKQPDFIALRALERAIIDAKAAMNNEAAVAGSPAVYSSKVRRRTDRSSQIQSAYDCIMLTGHPLSTDELLVKIELVGIQIGGTDKKTNLSSALSRDARFASISWDEKRKWWLVELGEPPRASTILRPDQPIAPHTAMQTRLV
jgi:hypothetical protein